MSADLLAGLDPFLSAPSHNNIGAEKDGAWTGTGKQNTQNASKQSNEHLFSKPFQADTLGQQQSGRSEATEEVNDEANAVDFGDFEVAVENADGGDSCEESDSNTAAKPYGELDRNFGRNRGHAASKSVTMDPRPLQRVRAATEDFFSGRLVDMVQDDSQRVDAPAPEPQPTTVRNRKEKSTRTRNSDILFDADDLSSDEDDFGDFETAPEDVAKPAAVPPKVENLLDDDPEEMTTSFAAMDMGATQPITATNDLLFSIDGKQDLSSPSKTSVVSPYKSSQWQGFPVKSPSSRRQPSHGTILQSPPKQATKQVRAQNELEDLFGTSGNAAETRRRQASVMNTSVNPRPKGRLPAKTLQPQKQPWDEWDAFESTPKEQPKPQSKSTTKAKPAFRVPSAKVDIYDDDDWGAWDDTETSTTTATTATTQSSSARPSAESSKPTIDDESPPPTNVPPPSILMSVIPEILTSLQGTIFSPSFKTGITTNPSTVEPLKQYLSIGTAAAHVIAGRKQRWKRDTHLSQSMSISQAGAGGKSGMKLAGIDKAEVAREDREAGDLVRSWKENVGKLRSTVVAANAALADKRAHLVVPEVNEVMPVKAASAAEGGLKALKCCFVCGLKREERVAKVDVDVEDSFGEWWVEYWGHRGCKDFWIEWSGKLKQR